MDDHKSDWFAGDVDCDGNELITVRKDEWNTICDQREKFMWQVRDTCVRAEKAEARIAELETDRDGLRRFVEKAEQVFRHYGDLHAAKPDQIKAIRNYDLADEARQALGAKP